VSPFPRIKLLAFSDSRNASLSQVYWSNAVQIIPPHDHGIASAILKSLDVPEEAWQVEGRPSESKWDGTQAMIKQYLEMAVTLSTRRK
jgi:phosphoglucomutase